MTKAQKLLYFREYAHVVRACKAHAWPVPDRHELTVRALGAMKSSKDFSNADLDKVLGVMRALSAPGSMQAQLRQQEQPTTRVHWKIREVLQCLAIYPLEEPMGTDRARAYAREILRDKVNRGSWRNVADIEDLSDRPGSRVDGDGDLVETPSQVMQLVMDLSRNLNRMRNASGHTGHEMCMAAGVKCRCKLICRPRPRLRMNALPGEIREAISAGADEHQPF